MTRAQFLSCHLQLLQEFSEHFKLVFLEMTYTDKLSVLLDNVQLTNCHEYQEFYIWLCRYMMIFHHDPFRIIVLDYIHFRESQAAMISIERFIDYLELLIEEDNRKEQFIFMTWPV